MLQTHEVRFLFVTLLIGQTFAYVSILQVLFHT